jgi:hypothetical protein
VREAPCPIRRLLASVPVPPAPTNLTAVEIRRVHTKDASAAVDYAKQNNPSNGTVIRVFNDAGNVIETHNHAGDFKEPSASVATRPEFYLKLVRLMLQNRARIALR